jgi:polar amino acid transport system ATP-binding protein
VTQANPILAAKNIQKAFGDNQVLKGVSLSVARGEVVSLIGASGSGKSTFLRCLNLLETPQAGELAIGRHHFEFGKDQRVPGKAQLALLRRDVGMVFQHFNLFPHRSVLDNVIEGPVQVKNMAKAEAKELGRDLLAKVGLADKADSFPSRLSGGQKQRVAIARALIGKPRMILADEPTGALDSTTSGEIMDLLAEINREGVTVLIVTHDSEVASRTPRTIRIHDGKILSADDAAAHVAAAAASTPIAPAGPNEPAVS